MTSPKPSDQGGPTAARPGADQSPWLLLGVFAVVAALLFGLFQLTGNDPPAPTSTPTPSPTPTDLQAEPDVAVSTERFQRGLVLDRRSNPRPKGSELAPASSGRSGTGLRFGELPVLDLPAGGPVAGGVRTAVANLPGRTSNAGFASSMRTLAGSRPDFIMLNEVSRHGDAALEAAAPGYDAYRDPVPDRSRGGSQAMNNAVMWRTDTWTMIDAGRVKVVDDDTGFHAGHAFVWDRYATWATLQRKDGAIVSVISSHMMTNPAKFPRQPGRPGETRVSRYARGMDVIGRLAGVLGSHGPVLIGGDMNSHAGQGGWTAAARLAAAGFRHVKDRGVMYLFYENDARVVGHTQVSVTSDHPAIVTTLDLFRPGAT